MWSVQGSLHLARNVTGDCYETCSDFFDGWFCHAVT